MAITQKRKAPAVHAKKFSLGYKKKGQDGKMWRIIKTKKGVKRWARISVKTLKKYKTLNKSKGNKKELFDKLYTNYFYYFDKLEKNIYPWWSKLSEGEIIIIFKDKTYKFCKSNRKTSNAKANDLKKKWKKYGEDKNVVGIIWSAMSIDTLQHFINYLVFKMRKKTLEKIIKMNKKNLQKYLIQNYKKYFYKYEMITKKDLMFKGRKSI